MATLEYLVDQCITKLRLQAGLNVNTYTEERLATDIELQFRRLFKLRFWDDYVSTVEYAFDTDNGYVSGDVSSHFSRFTDIQHVWVDSQSYPLKKVPENINPSSLRKHYLIPYMSDTTKLFKVTQPENITNVTVRARTLPDLPFTNSSEIALDETLLIYASLHAYTVETGLNDAAAELFATMYSDQLSNVLKEQNYSVMDAEPFTSTDVTGWYNDA